jgi:hypothetical protein
VSTKKVLDAHERKRCALPYIPAQNLDDHVYGRILYKLANEDDPEQESSTYNAMVEDTRYEEKIREHQDHLETLKKQLARNEQQFPEFS